MSPIASAGLRGAIASALRAPVGKLLRDFDAVVRVRRATRVPQSDNSTRPTWGTIADGDEVPAFLDLELSTEASDVGELQPTQRGTATLSAVCTPLPDDGILLLAGPYAGRRFRILEVKDAGGVVLICPVVATAETLEGFA